MSGTALPTFAPLFRKTAEIRLDSSNQKKKNSDRLAQTKKKQRRRHLNLEPEHEHRYAKTKGGRLREKNRYQGGQTRFGFDSCRLGI
jgi:hypothetical protein